MVWASLSILKSLNDIKFAGCRLYRIIFIYPPSNINLVGQYNAIIFYYFANAAFLCLARQACRNQTKHLFSYSSSSKENSGAQAKGENNFFTKSHVLARVYSFCNGLWPEANHAVMKTPDGTRQRKIISTISNYQFATTGTLFHLHILPLSVYPYPYQELL